MTEAHGTALAAVLLAAAAGCASPPASPTPRHLVLISLDTTRADHMGFYGNPRVATPHLDRLAAESIVLDDLMTVAPTTLASHASLFTGTYPQTHGVPRNGFLLDESNLTLAEMLAAQGFSTAGFAASFALSGRFRIDQGFAHYDERFEREAGAAGRMQNERSAASVTDAVIGYLDRNPVPERLFLFVHYFDAHSPYAAPAPYETMYDPRGREGLPGWFEVAQDCWHRGGGKTPDGERLAAQYAAEISYLDEHVGRLLDDLRRRGILDDALVVVTSDHGESLWDRPECFDHGWLTYQQTMHAIGVLRLPGAAGAGRRIPTLAANIDLLPTMLELLELPASPDVEGAPIDLSGAAAQGVPTRFGQATKPWEVETDPLWPNRTKARCVREGRYKLIQVPYAGVEELYDLAADPGERTNLLAAPGAEHAALATALRETLEAWAAAARPHPVAFDEHHREETLERLRALGYIEGAE